MKFAEPEDDAPLLPEERIKFIQQVVGVFLQYSIAIDNTLLVSLSNIGSKNPEQNSKPWMKYNSSSTNLHQISMQQLVFMPVG